MPKAQLEVVSWRLAPMEFETISKKCLYSVWNPLVYMACWMSPLFMNDCVRPSINCMENIGSPNYAASKCEHISLHKIYFKKESH